jgi:DNA segregation ATPase FtsK/SpoIIIE-like protein
VNKNRRVKKTSTFPYAFILPKALLIVVISVIIIALVMLVSSTFSSLEVEGADIFAVFSLFAIAISILGLILYGVKKAVGRSWLNGLELLGEQTLQLLNYISNKILDFIGVNSKNSSHRTKKIVNILNTKLDIIHEDRQNISAPQKKIDNIDRVISLKSVEEHKPALKSKVADLKIDEDRNLSSELFQNSFSAPIEKASANTVSVQNERVDKTLIKKVATISPVDDLRQNNFTLSDIDIAESSVNEPQIGQAIYEDMALEQKSEEKNIIIDVNAESKNVGNEFDSAVHTLENSFSKVSFDNNNIQDEPLDKHLVNEIEEPKIASSEADPLVESNLAAFNTNSLFSDLSKNKVMNLSKKNAENNIPDKGIFQFSSPKSILEQAKQVTGNIISELQPIFNDNNPENQYTLPAVSLLDIHQQSIYAYSDEELDEMAQTVERVLLDYKVNVEVQGAYPGPVITRFELSLAPGVKVSRVTGLAKDLARAMRVTSVRVVEIISGTSFVGLEIPNQARELVSFREIIASKEFQESKSPLTLSLGKDVSGKTVVSDLGKMPHVLVAGTTGSGKSVAINTMILSMLYKATPEQVRMIMIDPKMLELSVYEGIPHLLTPVVTDMNEAQSALRWAVAEMERRYKLMSKVGVRNLAGYNQKIDAAAERGETLRDPLFQLTKPLKKGETFPTLEKLPHIVIIIDELADMMMIVGKKVEELIARLAQKARAAGVHLILATQRPSVDVLTGLIKANVPTRISFQVSSRIDSRTILDQGGAEALLGNGDMLFLPSGTSIPIRAHGAFVADEEVHHVVEYLKTQGTVQYLTEITQEEMAETSGTATSVDETDALYNDALDFVYDTDKASISGLQRRFKIGYNRAARMIDQMEEENIVSQPGGNGSRSVIKRD